MLVTVFDDVDRLTSLLRHLCRGTAYQLDRLLRGQGVLKQPLKVSRVLGDPWIIARSYGEVPAPRVEVEDVGQPALELEQRKRAEKAWIRAGLERNHPHGYQLVPLGPVGDAAELSGHDPRISLDSDMPADYPFIDYEVLTRLTRSLG
jgi:hypothetical protein